MNILHVFKTYFPYTNGGVEAVIHQLAEGTRLHGVRAHVFALGPAHAPASASVDGHTVHFCPRHWEAASCPVSLSALGRFRRLAQQADLVHYHFPYPFADLLHFFSRVRTPSLVTYHSDIIRQKRLLRLYEPLQNRFLAAMDRVVATSPAYARTSPVLRALGSKVAVIPLGIDPSSCPAPPPEALARWKGRFPGPFFLFVGVLRYYKGLHFLVEAAKNAPYPVVIAGDGPEADRLVRQAGGPDGANIHFLGRVSTEDKAALLELCAGLVFPSHLRSEAFGVTLLEGAMYGKPLISCEIGTGTSFVNQDNVTGYVVPPGSPTQVRRAMDSLFDAPEKAAAMGRAARARYRELFTLDAMAAAYVSLYREILHTREGTLR